VSTLVKCPTVSQGLLVKKGGVIHGKIQNLPMFFFTQKHFYSRVATAKLCVRLSSTEQAMSSVEGRKYANHVIVVV